MAVDLDERLLREVQEKLGLPHPALVEKDFHVVQALKALSRFTTGEPRLVFGGGTALCRGRRLVQRMSEDIDLKALQDGPHTRGTRKAFVGQITDALKEAGFEFDHASQEHLEVHDSYRMVIYHLPYKAIAPVVGSLRPQIRIDISYWPLYCDPEGLPIRSYTAEALEEEAEIAHFPCVAVVETYAEKFVALTRRLGQERLDGEARDDSLLRHIYDLHCLKGAHRLDEVGELLHRVIAAERESRAKSYPAYRDDPLAAIEATLAEMRADPAYATSFARFQRDMVYGPHLDFGEGMDHLDEIGSFLRRQQA